MSAELLAKIPKAARHGEIRLSPHAEEEAGKANAQARDIKRAILSATQASEQEEGKVRLEGGSDVDGEPLRVVVRETHYGLRVITVF